MSSPNDLKLVESLNREVRRFIAGAILFNLKVAAEVGLNGTDMQCLNLLELQGSATPGEMARWALLTTGGVTVVLDRLEKAGYVRRAPNPQDRRSSIVRPVAAKFRKLHAHYRSKAEALMRVLSTYDENKLQLIMDFFTRANGERTPTSPRPIFLGRKAGRGRTVNNKPVAGNAGVSWAVPAVLIRATSRNSASAFSLLPMTR